MQPYIWGKYFWTTLHFISLGYPNNPSIQNKNEYKYFYENIYKFIPCSTCSDHCRTHLLEIPITHIILENEKSLFKWTVDLHNLVNKDLNKPIMCYNEAYQLYTKIHPDKNKSMERCFESLRNVKSTDINKLFALLNILMFILLIGLIFRFMRKSSRKLF